MDKRIIGILIGIALAKGSLGMEGDQLDDISRSQNPEVTSSQTLNSLLANPAAVQAEEPEIPSRALRRTSAVLVSLGHKFEPIVELKSTFPIDTENLLKRRATFLFDSYFSQPKELECFEAEVVEEKIILTYKKDVSSGDCGSISFNSKEEFLFCLKVLAQKAKTSRHIGMVNALLEKFK